MQRGTGDYRTAPVTRRQRQVILSLASRLGWSWVELSGWMQRQYGYNRVGALDRATARAVRIALSHRVRRERSEGTSHEKRMD